MLNLIDKSNVVSSVQVIYFILPKKKKKSNLLYLIFMLLSHNKSAES